MKETEERTDKRKDIQCSWIERINLIIKNHTMQSTQYIHVCIHMDVYTMGYCEYGICIHTHTIEYHSAIKIMKPCHLRQHRWTCGIACVCMLSCFSHVQLFVTQWIIAHQTPLSMGFSRQGYWSGSPCPSPGDLPHPGTEPTSHMSHCIGRQALYLLYHLGSPEGIILVQ